MMLMPSHSQRVTFGHTELYLKSCSDISDHVMEQAKSSSTNIDKLWNYFKTNLLKTVDENVPSKMTRPKKSSPWINRNLTKQLKKKSRLYRKAKSSGKWEKYRHFSKEVKRNIRKAEWNHVNNVIKDNLEQNNTKPLFSYCKSKRQDNIGIAPLKSKGNLLTDAKSKANVLIKQFVSVFTRDSGNVTPEIGKHRNTKTAPQLNIDRKGVLKILKNINIHKAMGPDGIPNILLKTCAEEISYGLSAIFQYSLDTGTLPLDWRNANVTPVFKKGDRHLAENYRPVSLTSVSCKIMEHIICSHMLKHFEKHNILTSLNHGFRSGYSTETQLLVTMQDLLQANDRNIQMDIAILDFSKAFDTVPHDRLLQKLEAYGIRGNLHKWLSSFLKDRQMNVVVEGEHSESAYVESGVPQGTVLGPLMFLCHINDLPDCVKSQVRLFADDCLIYREIKTQKDHQILQNDLKELENWAAKWGMRFNAKKCYILSIRQKSSHFYQLDGEILQQVDSNPYLGLTISEDLQWKTHITNITKKANSSLGFLRRNLKYCSEDCKRLAYIALVRSILEYGAVVWDPYQSRDIIAVEKVQRQAARFIKNDYKSRFEGCVTSMLEDLKLPILQQRRLETRLVMLYKVVRGMVPAINADEFLIPIRNKRNIKPRVQSDFQTTNIVEKFSTNHSECFKIPDSHTEQYRNSFFVRTVSEWNQLEESHIRAETVNSFREAVHKCY